MQGFGYKQNHANHTLFIKHFSQGKVTALIVYAENFLLIRNDNKEMQSLKNYLASGFEISYAFKIFSSLK